MNVIDRMEDLLERVDDPQLKKVINKMIRQGYDSYERGLPQLSKLLKERGEDTRQLYELMMMRQQVEELRGRLEAEVDKYLSTIK